LYHLADYGTQNYHEGPLQWTRFCGFLSDLLDVRHSLKRVMAVIVEPPIAVLTIGWFRDLIQGQNVVGR
jgi:hypothetical protein